MNLHKAAERDDSKAIEQSLAAGQAVDQTDAQGATPLFVAVSLGMAKAARALLDGGANANATDKNGISILCCAVSAGSGQLVRLLLERGADPNGNRAQVAKGKTQNTPLMETAVLGEPKIAELLLQAGADPSVSRPDGTTIFGMLDRLEAYSPKNAATIRELLQASGAKAKDPLADELPTEPVEPLPGATSSKLHDAAKKGDVAMLRRVLAAKVPVDRADGEGFTALMHAVQAAQVMACRVLLASGANTNVVLPSGACPLRLAAESANLDLAKILLANGADPNLGNDRVKEGRLGKTILMEAVVARNGKLVDHLIEKGADVTAMTRSGTTAAELARDMMQNALAKKLEAREKAASPQPEQTAAPPGKAKKEKKPWDVSNKLNKLHKAILKGSLEEIRTAITEGIPLERRTPDFATPLMLAANTGNWDAFQLLLEAGADPEPSCMKQRVDGFGAAIGGGDLRIVDWYLERGAAINGRIGDVDYHGPDRLATPLMAAVSAGNVPVVARLLERGADPAAVWERSGKTDRVRALDVAMEASFPPDSKEDEARQMIAGLLKAKGAPAVKPPVAPIDFVKQLPKLHQAACRGDVAKIKELLAAGKSVDVRDQHRKTALLRAAQNGQAEAFRALVEAGADIHAGDRDKNAGTEDALMAAAAGGSVEIVRFLLEQGFPVERTRHPSQEQKSRAAQAGLGRFLTGSTPLSSAVLARHHDVARVLLEAGADPNFKGMLGSLTAIAKKNKDKAMLELLVAHGAAVIAKDPSKQLVKGFSAAAAMPAFQKVLGELASLTGKPPVESTKVPGTYQIVLRKPEEAAKSLALDLSGTEPEKRSAAVVHHLAEKVRATGFHLIVADLQLENKPTKLVLLPTADKFAVIAARGTNGVNYGLTNQDVVAWLRELDADDPFVLTDCWLDYVGGRFMQPLSAEGAAKWGPKMVAFCPDLVDGDVVESADDLAAQLKGTEEFGFWWD